VYESPVEVLIHLQVLVFFVQLVEIKLKLNNDKRMIIIFLISKFAQLYPIGRIGFSDFGIFAKISQSYLLSTNYMVLFVTISWKIHINSLAIMFTLF
jgi:hypothetical protein